jgi:hypothetical protein
VSDKEEQVEERSLFGFKSEFALLFPFDIESDSSFFFVVVR